MKGIERDYLNALIGALMEANRSMMCTSIEEAIGKSFVEHKGDTLGLDQRPENTIKSELEDFDQYAILITEERGTAANPLISRTSTGVHGASTFFCCDPCDRSSEFRAFLDCHGKGKKHVGDVLLSKDCVTNWEKKGGKPASITGCNAGLTCIRRGLPICSVLLNYITQDLTLVCHAGIFTHHLSLRGRGKLDFELIRQKGRRINFPDVARKNEQRVVTFLGKPERGYPKNFCDIRLVVEDELNKHVHYAKPGGPTRILYLSSMFTDLKRVGLIVANGEKIGEWIHWLPAIRFARQPEDINEPALRIYEVSPTQSQMRDGYLMAPTEYYSTFKEADDGTNYLDVNSLRSLPNPSKYRATLIVTTRSNRWANSKAEQFGYRELNFAV